MLKRDVHAGSGLLQVILERFALQSGEARYTYRNRWITLREENGKKPVISLHKACLITPQYGMVG